MRREEGRSEERVDGGASAQPKSDEKLEIRHEDVESKRLPERREVTRHDRCISAARIERKSGTRGSIPNSCELNYGTSAGTSASKPLIYVLVKVIGIVSLFSAFLARAARRTWFNNIFIYLFIYLFI